MKYSIKDSKKVELFWKVVELFKQDHEGRLSEIIPGAYRKTYGDNQPIDENLVCVGITDGCSYYVPKKYRRVFEIKDYGYWDYMLICPVTGEKVIVSAHLGSSVEARLLMGV